jgi:lysophospholipase L1-like esterase
MDTPTEKTLDLKKHLQNFLGAVAIVTITIALLEIALRVLDPWGLTYFSDLGRLGNEIFTADDQRGYIMPDGTYAFRYWQATLKDGKRVLPNNNPDATCEIAILGDSVAFGYGVNDDQVWLNSVARNMPNVHFHNYGVPRYNSTNVLQTLNSVPSANAYLYLVVNNDTEPAIDVRTQRFAGSGEGLPFILRYSNFLIYRGGGTDYIPPMVGNTALLPDSDNTRRFLAEVAQMMGDERVFLASFSDEAITNSLLAQGYTVTSVAYPAQNRISVSDYHANAEGNIKIGEALLPTLQAMAQAHCNG